MAVNPVRAAARAVRLLAARTPPRRNRYVDLLRALAITAVVAGHWLAVHVTYDAAGRLSGANVLAVLPWAAPLTWSFQVMPVFFLVGGFANAASWTSWRRRGGRGAGWLLDRTDRLVRPATALPAVLGAAALLAGAAGVPDRTAGLAVWLASIPLWFLAAYLAVVALTPLMHALHRRAGLAVPVALAAAVAAADLARLGFGVPYVGAANFLLAWLAVHQLGFAWQDGRLPVRRGTALPLAAGGLAALVLLTVAGPYPVSMVGAGGEELENTSPPTVALLALAAAQTGIVLLCHAPASRLLRRPAAWAAVVGVNAVILTLFLWHMTAAVLGVLALHAAGALPQAAPGSPPWLLSRLPWLALLTLILAVLVAVFGPVERRGGPRPGPAGARGPAAVAAVYAGTAGVLAGLLGIALAGPGHHGPAGLPTWALLAYLTGAAVLRLARRRCRSPAAR